MAVEQDELGWPSWREIPRLATSVVAVPVVVGYVSLGAVVLLGRSVQEVLRGASRALDRVVGNTRETSAIGEWLRGKPTPTKRNRRRVARAETARK